MKAANRNGLAAFAILDPRLDRHGTGNRKTIESSTSLLFCLGGNSETLYEGRSVEPIGAGL